MSPLRGPEVQRHSGRVGEAWEAPSSEEGAQASGTLLNQKGPRVFPGLWPGGCNLWKSAPQTVSGSCSMAAQEKTLCCFRKISSCFSKETLLINLLFTENINIVESSFPLKTKASKYWNFAQNEKSKLY